MVTKSIDVGKESPSARFKIWIKETPDDEHSVISLKDLRYDILVFREDNKLKFKITSESPIEDNIIMEVSFDRGQKSIYNVKITAKFLEGEIEVPFKLPAVEHHFSSLDVKNDNRVKDAMTIMNEGHMDMANALVLAIDLYSQMLLEDSGSLRKSEYLLKTGLYRLAELSKLRTYILDSRKDGNKLEMTDEPV